MIVKLSTGGTTQAVGGSTGVKSGFMNSGAYSAIANGVGGIFDSFPTPNLELNENNNLTSNIRSGVSTGLMASGNPYAMAAGVALKVLDKTGAFTDASDGLGSTNDTLNAIASIALPGAGWFGRRTENYKISADMKAMASGYASAMKNNLVAQRNAGIKILFGFNKAQSLIHSAKVKDRIISNIKQKADEDMQSAATMTQAKAMQNQYDYMGGYNQALARAAKNGAKLEQIIRVKKLLTKPKEIEEFKEGGTLPEEFVPTTQEQDLDFFNNLTFENPLEIDSFKKGGKYSNGLKSSTKECAEFSNGELRDLGYLINGNAWNLKNADLLYSGYNTDNYPSQWDLNDVVRYNNEAADRFFKEFDSNTLDKDSTYAVNMYYSGSPALEQAYREGRDKMTGTHTGYVSWNPETNRWEVTHNIHGNIHVDPFTKIQGGNRKYGITGIFSLRKDNLLNNLRSILGLGEGGTIEEFQGGGKTKKRKYSDWVKDVNPNNISDDYDLEKAYNELPIEKLEAWKKDPKNNHLDSKYKKPNHMTYSYPGYGWSLDDKGNWTFTISPEQYLLHGGNDGAWDKYVKYWNENEPEATLRTWNGTLTYKVPKVMEAMDRARNDSSKQYVEKPNSLYVEKPKIFADGGAVNVIPEGNLHARLHHMEDAEGLTKKGVPVVDRDGNLQAEIELNEIILHLELTKKLEELCNKFYNDETKSRDKEDLAIEAGKLLAKEIMENTDDRTGLMNEVA